MKALVSKEDTLLAVGKDTDTYDSEKNIFAGITYIDGFPDGATVKDVGDPVEGDKPVYDADTQNLRSYYDYTDGTLTRQYKVVDKPVKEEPPQRDPIPQKLTKLQFIRHIQEHGGTSKSDVSAAYKDPELEYFWLIFDIATEVEKSDPEIDEALGVFETQGYLPNGAQSVLDNWPTR